MPELPEVESFRHLLLGLVVGGVKDKVEHQNVDCPESRCLQIEAVGESSRIRLSSTDRAEIAQHYACTDIRRKGKQLCLVLTDRNRTTNKRATKYLYLHMGMTGRIRVEGREENWGGKKMNGEEPASIRKASGGGSGSTSASKQQNATKEESSSGSLLLFSPKYTLLIFRSNNYTAYFCDPRKFGSCHLADDCSALDELAPDALDYNNNNNNDESSVQERILSALCHQTRGIKAILLDQKRAVSGVGNWVADEVLYQCQMHPDQTLLTRDEAGQVMRTTQSILRTAVQCLVQEDSHYPEDWLFNYRWTKKQKDSMDAHGRSITFLQSGGRTSAIVALIQKLDKQRTRNQKSHSNSKKANAGGPVDRASELEAKSLVSSTPAGTRKRKLVTDLHQFQHKDTTASSATAIPTFSRKNTDTSTTDTEMTTESSAVTSMATKQKRRSPRFRDVVTP